MERNTIYTDDVPADEKTIKCSTTDPESGWFRKGEELRKFFLKTGIDTLEIDTAKPYIDGVRALFKRRARKR